MQTHLLIFKLRFWISQTHLRNLENNCKINLLIKTESDNPTIGIILCREKTKFSVEYSLRDINKPIGVSSYEISKVLPKDILEVLPTEEDLNLHIDIIEEENE